VNNWDAYRYTITIRRVTMAVETMFRATCAELPDCAEYAETPSGAYHLMIDAIEALHARSIEDGDTFPDPLPSEL
jgi:predicted RNase H-like HicB family nuclease